MGRYLDLLKAKKNENGPPPPLRNLRNPQIPEQTPSFVGFVAYPPPHFGKNDAVNDATAKPDSVTATPEQSDSFVGFVAYLSPHFGKNEGEPKPTDTTTAPAVDWHQADKRYQSHHWGCPICIASGKGHGGQMCDEGARLHAAYESTPMPEFGKAKRFTPTA